MAEKSPNWIKTKTPQIKEAQQVPDSSSKMITIPRHFMIKFLQIQWLRKKIKLQEKILFIHRKKDMDDSKLIVGNNAREKTLESTYRVLNQNKQNLPIYSTVPSKSKFQKQRCYIKTWSCITYIYIIFVNYTSVKPEKLFTS